MKSWFYPLAALLLAAAVSRAADVSPARPVIPERTFTLTDFGAVPDGRTTNEQAFRKAVQAVEAAGGGTLVVPAGTWLTRPFDLTSSMNLRLEQGATIQFTTDPADSRTGERKYRPFLYTKNAHDVMISGSGTIDGQGQAWWPEAVRFRDEANRRHASSNTSPRPRLIIFDHCQRVMVEGVTLTRSPVFSLVPMYCDDVTILNVRILNPADAPNTDGIDPSVCRRVLIKGCLIDTGDDCIAVKAGDKDGRICEDLLIVDCTFRHGHGCSVGSETVSGLRNMTVRNCSFDGTDIGVRFKSDRRRGGLVENVLYDGITMVNVGQAIVISSYYQGTTTDMRKGGHVEEPVEVTRTTPHWRNIVVKNLKATACTKNAGMVMGLPEMPAEQIVLDHVEIDAPSGLRIGNAKDVVLRQVKIEARKGPDLLVDDTVKGLVRE